MADERMIHFKVGQRCGVYATKCALEKVLNEAELSECCKSAISGLVISISSNLAMIDAEIISDPYGANMLSNIIDGVKDENGGTE